MHIAPTNQYSLGTPAQQEVRQQSGLILEQRTDLSRSAKKLIESCQRIFLVERDHPLSSRARGVLARCKALDTEIVSGPGWGDGDQEDGQDTGQWEDIHYTHWGRLGRPRRFGVGSATTGCDAAKSALDVRLPRPRPSRFANPDRRSL
jgi:hypothetical protein